MYLESRDSKLLDGELASSFSVPGTMEVGELAPGDSSVAIGESELEQERPRSATATKKQALLIGFCGPIMLKRAPFGYRRRKRARHRNFPRR